MGSIGIEALFSGLARGVLNAGFIFWMLVFASALLLGRAFCGWFCWFGGYLDLIEWGIGKLKIKIPPESQRGVAVGRCRGQGRAGFSQAEESFRGRGDKRFADTTAPTSRASILC